MRFSKSRNHCHLQSRRFQCTCVRNTMRSKHRRGTCQMIRSTLSFVMLSSLLEGGLRKVEAEMTTKVLVYSMYSLLCVVLEIQKLSLGSSGESRELCCV